LPPLKVRQSDGLVWERSDYSKDGVHPTVKGREKVADQLLRFFKEDAGTKMWFVKT
jgi:lysophospholipase L1-like esterase